MSSNGLDISRLVCLGINHHTAPVEIRERLGKLSTSNWEPYIQIAIERAVLSTCNRLELYLFLEPDTSGDSAALQAGLESAAGFVPGELTNHLYIHRGRDVARHLATVACGLDSLILGETEIQRQVTDAYMSATADRTLGPILDTIFLCAVRAGKRARAETGISMRPASISSVAISHVESMIGGLAAHDFLVVGLGEMGQATTRALLYRGVSSVAVTNRTNSRAQALEPLGIRVYAFEELETAIAEADVVFTATSSRIPVVTTAMVRRALDRRMSSNRASRVLYMIDIAVPRDIEANVGQLHNVRLVDIDHLQVSLDQALEGRRQAIPEVNAIIEHELDQLDGDLRQLTARPLVADLRQQAEAIRAQQVERSLRLMGNVDPALAQHVELMSRALVNKLLHQPTLRLKQAAVDERLLDYEHAVRELFGLRNGNDSQSE